MMKLHLLVTKIIGIPQREENTKYGYNQNISSSSMQKDNVAR